MPTSIRNGKTWIRWLLFSIGRDCSKPFQPHCVLQVCVRSCDAVVRRQVSSPFITIFFLLLFFLLKSIICGYSTYTFLTYVNGWQSETGKFVTFVPHFTMGRCIERGQKQAQVFDLFRNSQTPGSLSFLQNLLSMDAMQPFRDSGASTLLLQEFVNTTTLDHLGSVVQVYVDFTVGVRNNYTAIQAALGCLMPKSQTSQIVYPPVSKLEYLNPVGLNVTNIQNEDTAIFCGHLGISINCIGFDFERCLSKILLPMQTDGLLPFCSTQRCDEGFR